MPIKPWNYIYKYYRKKNLRDIRNIKWLGMAKIWGLKVSNQVKSLCAKNSHHFLFLFGLFFGENPSAWVKVKHTICFSHAFPTKTVCGFQVVLHWRSKNHNCKKRVAKRTTITIYILKFMKYPVSGFVLFLYFNKIV